MGEGAKSCHALSSPSWEAFLESSPNCAHLSNCHLHGNRVFYGGNGQALEAQFRGFQVYITLSGRWRWHFSPPTPQTPFLFPSKICSEGLGSMEVSWKKGVLNIFIHSVFFLLLNHFGDYKNESEILSPWGAHCLIALENENLTVSMCKSVTSIHSFTYPLCAGSYTGLQI